MQDRSRDYWVGFGLTALGAIVLSPDAMLFKLLQSDPWTSIFWRGLLLGAVVWTLLVWRRGGALLADMRGLGWALPAATICWTISNLGFLIALTYTSVADTLAIIATAPVFAAIFGLALGERLPARTWAAALAIAVGIGVIFDASFAADTWLGALSAGATAIAIAAFFTIGRMRRDVDLTPALASSAFLTASVAAVFADTLVPVPADWPNLLLIGLVILPISLTLITLGPRRLPAAEVGLLMLLETALGPIWALVFINETPSAATLLGGGLIVGALFLHGLAAWAADRKRRRARRALS